jgi:hypothetical protein
VVTCLRESLLISAMATQAQTHTLVVALVIVTVQGMRDDSSHCHILLYNAADTPKTWALRSVTTTTAT